MWYVVGLLAGLLLIVTPIAVANTVGVHNIPDPVGIFLGMLFVSGILTAACTAMTWVADRFDRYGERRREALRKSGMR